MKRFSCHRGLRRLLAAVLAALVIAAPAAAAAPPPAPGGPAAAPLNDIHDIKPPMPLGTASSPLVAVLAAVAALLLAGGLAYVLRRRKPRATPAPAPVAPEKAALDALTALAGARQADARTFYFRLSAVLRAYLEARYGIKAVEMTTEELLPSLASLVKPPELADRLEELMTGADPIKFAGAPALGGRMEDDLAFARRFVEQTTPSGDGPAAAPGVEAAGAGAISTS